jgi:hypothetical protein
MIPKCTDRDFLRYRYGKYREIPTDTDRKIPIRYNSNVYASFSYYVLVEVFPRQIKMSAILISLPRRSNVEAWYYFLALAFLDNWGGVQNGTTTSHNIVTKKVEVTFQVGK